MKSWTIGSTLAIVGMSARIAVACDCTIYPFTPTIPCQKECTTLILNKSSTTTLKNVLGLPAGVANKINALRIKQGTTLSLEDFNAALTLDEKDVLQKKLSELDTKKVKTLDSERLWDLNSQ